MTDNLLKYLNKYITSMKNEVPGLISVSVVEITTGRTFVSAKGSLSISDTTELNKLQTSAVKFALKGLEHIHDPNTKRLENIIISLENQTHIIMTSELQSFMGYIIIDANAGNIALTQSLHNKHYSIALSELIQEFGEESIRNHPFFQPKDFTVQIGEVREERKDIQIEENKDKEREQKEKEERQKRSGFLRDLFYN